MKTEIPIANKEENWTFDLNKDSIVFDVGGYIGDFTKSIYEKYGSIIYCFEPVVKYAESLKYKFSSYTNIKVFPFGIMDENKSLLFYINKDKSSLIEVNGEISYCEFRTLDDIMNAYSINFIDLIKLNIEGSEYSVLEDMIKKDLIQKCGNIIIQFHTSVPLYNERRDAIINELSKTHTCEWCSDFIWEYWKIK